MTDRLRQLQTVAMFTLMRLAREVSNKELQDMVGITLVGKDRTELNSMGFVDSHKEKQIFVHKLTKRGHEWCGQELRAMTPPPSSASNRLVAALYVLLGEVDRYMRQKNLRLIDAFSDQDAVTPEDIEDRIRTVYHKLARAPRDWVGLVDMRPLLGDASVDEVDAVLKELSRTGQIHLVPESNRKALTKADHEAAIRIGGEDNHLISIEGS